MSAERRQELDPRIQQAVAELESIISRRYPSTTFELSRAVDDPEIIHLTATVDLDDPDEVSDLVIERELQLQVDEGIPLYVIPIRNPERIAAARAQQRASYQHGTRSLLSKR